MKKSLAIVLVALLSMMIMASAVITSPTLDITTEVSAEGFVFEVDEDGAEAAAEELAAAVEDVDAYFGEAADDAKAITGNDELEIVEFAPVIVSGYTDDMGDIAITVTAPTAAEEGQTVAVLIGVNGEWSAFEGTGNADGEIEFTLGADVAKAASEAGNALMAIAF